MRMKIKTFVIITALLSFSTSLFAKPVLYSFSGFGGGLPSSASVVSYGAESETTSQQIILNDYEDEEDSYDYYDEPSVSKSKKAALITTYIVLGAVVVGGIVFGSVYLSNESAQCCESASDNLMEGCAQGCGESCGQSCGDSLSQACSDSMSEACSESVTCETDSLSLLSGGFNLIPVFVP